MKFTKRNDTIANDKIVTMLCSELNICRLTSSILVNRGYNSLDSAKKYLGLSGRDFSNPFDISNMHDAVDRINEAIANKENIVIYSDYDTDGVCACSLLLNGFEISGYKNVSYYTPEREGEGYGLNAEAVGKLSREKCRLLITVDCGISNVEEIKLAKFLGIDVIVTDHHSCPPTLPECIIVNPKLSGAKGQEYLCGASVAMKLSQAVFGGNSENREMELAAIATISDMVPLVGENRHIVNLGLEILNNRPSTAIGELIKMAVGDKDISSEDIGYKIGPIINAAGRIATAHICIDLFTGRAESIKESVAKLIDYNNERKDIQNEVYNQAKEKVLDLDLINNNGIILYDENWTLGVVGIVASRLMNDYGRPIVMLTKSNEHIKGSIRSVDGINIFDVLCNISELFESFGGHSKAAGITLKNDDVQGFAGRFNRELDDFDKALFDKTVYYDIVCEPKDINLDTVNEIRMMEPFGQDNPSVSLLVEGAKAIDYTVMGKEKNHYRATFAKGAGGVKGVGFFSSLADGAASGNMLCDVVLSPSINSFNGHTSVQGMINSVKSYYESEADYLEFIDCIAPKFIESNIGNQNSLTDDKYLEIETTSIDELREILQSTSYQNLVIADNINIARELYAQLSKEVMNKTHISVEDIDVQINGANTILLAPDYSQLKSKIYKRVYYINVNENVNIIKKLSQSLHDNIQVVIMGDIKPADTRIITIERLRELYTTIKGLGGNLTGINYLLEMGYKQKIAKYEMLIAHEVFIESGLLIFDKIKSEYIVKSKAAVDVKETLAFKKFIIE